MAKIESREWIEEQAAIWAARSGLGEMNAEDRAQFEAWLAQDRLHEGAYLRARASLYLVEDAVAANPQMRPSENDNHRDVTAASRRLARGPVMAAALAIAACAMGLVWVGATRVAAPGNADQAATGEQMLADGSRAVLDVDGAISVTMNAQARNVVLTHGEATFHVHKDAARPFTVQSGAIFAQATGTVYSVRRLGEEGGAVRVQEGTVLVWAQGARDRAVSLHAGEQAEFTPASFTASITAPTGKDVRAKQFSFDNIPIATAAAQFNAVNRVRIVIDDPAIGDVPVVGVFQSDQPEEFAEAAAAITDGRVVRRQGDIVIEK